MERYFYFCIASLGFVFVSCIPIPEPVENEPEMAAEGQFPGECTDGADNDGDGDFDCSDSDCQGSPDCIENHSDGGCADGTDSDADGLVDCDDPDCSEEAECTEGPEVCNDGLDNDNDGLIDCADSDCGSSPDCLIDADGDGFYSTEDCDDSDPGVYPGAPEVANDGIDQDCSGADYTTGGGGGGWDTGTDDGSDSGGGGSASGQLCEDSCAVDPMITSMFSLLGYSVAGANDGFCSDGGQGDVLYSQLEILGLGSVPICALGTDCSDCGTRTDMDGDGYGADPLGLAPYSDCDDSDPSINSGATDIPDDGIDQDCDGSDAAGGSSGGGASVLCEDTCSWVADGVCDDGGADAPYGVCDFGTDCTDCGSRVDSDGDGYHWSGGFPPLNEALIGTVDCDDNDPTIHPGALDIPNDGIDQDCDGSDAI
jgi:hypothetical protein